MCGGCALDSKKPKSAQEKYLVPESRLVYQCRPPDLKPLQSFRNVNGLTCALSVPVPSVSFSQFALLFKHANFTANAFVSLKSPQYRQTQRLFLQLYSHSAGTALSAAPSVHIDFHRRNTYASRHHKMSTWDDLPVELVCDVIRYIIESYDSGSFMHRIQEILRLSLVNKQFLSLVWQWQTRVDFSKARSMHKSRVANLALYAIINRARGIQDINVSDCRLLSDNALKHVGNICGPSLLSISLHDAGKAVTHEGLSYLFSRCHNLIRVDLSLFDQTIITDALVTQLCHLCVNVEELTLRSERCTDAGGNTYVGVTSVLTEDPVFGPIGTLKRLYSLNLGGCHGLSIHGLASLMIKSNTITRLGILNNTALACAKLHSWPPLTFLSLADSNLINDDSVELLLPFFSQMQKMSLNRTDVSQSGIIRLCRRFAQLKNLDLRNLSRVYPRFLHELAENYPDLTWTHYYAGRLMTSGRLQEEQDALRRKRRSERRAGVIV
ncbi:hypothetical protein PROFUN_05147 [Planoprotostelium fungivorum]|uniref:RNI-like protein n=1 Tax=Planoprotostelium fungivorum TaxID=1890364 RepID=A0A2P6NS25_9EUKA|nr:hypothetical protein PROFUN_05147 [Planoprotostelium fungivorum]